MYFLIINLFWLQPRRAIDKIRARQILKEIKGHPEKFFHRRVRKGRREKKKIKICINSGL
jgi:hypothetical protein